MGKHNEHGFYTFDNCVGCHKSGNEDDIILDGKANGRSNNKEEKKKHKETEEGDDD
jgi:hypothetical protein